MAWPSFSGCCWCSICYSSKCQSKGCILQVLWDPALVITFTLGMGIIAWYSVWGFMYKKSLHMAETCVFWHGVNHLISVPLYPLPSCVSTVYAWCNVLRAETFSQGWCLTQLVSYCNNQRSVFIPLWDSHFCFLSAVGCCVRNAHFCLAQ